MYTITKSLPVCLDSSPTSFDDSQSFAEEGHLYPSQHSLSPVTSTIVLINGMVNWMILILK